jgi:hypothetical protein
MNNMSENVKQPESAGDVGSTRLVRPFNPWTQHSNAMKLKEARKANARRKALKYRHENIEERRNRERDWHRLKLGIPLEAPLMKRGRKPVRPNK